MVARSIMGIAAAACLLGACATTEPRGSGVRTTYNDCFFASTLRDWRPLDDSNLILFADGRRPYLVELVRPAMGLTFNVMIGVYDRDGRICPYGGDAIVVDGALPDRITIRSIRRLADAELGEIYERFGVSTPAVIEAEEAPIEAEEAPLEGDGAP